MFTSLDQINSKPKVFETYNAPSLWTDPYRSKQMMAFHLNETLDVSSRNSAFIETSSAWIIDHFKLGPGRSVCDFGCGPGLYTSRFARSGAQVTGLDFSKKSIEHARKQAQGAHQNITYIEGNYLDFEPQERFDLITMIMCDYCALGPSQRRALLMIFRNALKEGGSILLDVYSLAAYAAREETRFYEKNHLDQFWFEEDYYCFVNTFKYEDDCVVLDKYSLFPQSGGSETVHNWLQYFSAKSLAEEIAAAGFEVRHLYKDVDGNAFCDQHNEFAIVATVTS